MTEKTLYLLRHAKAAAHTPGVDDQGRELSERGVKNARQMGEYLKKQRIAPELVLCSNAERTQRTMAELESTYGPLAAKQVVPALYLCSEKQLLQILADVPDEVNSVMIIGHNPTLHQLAVDLCAEGDEEQLEELSMRFPTATFAEISYPAKIWAEFGPKRGVLKRLTMPKTLQQVA